MGTRVDKEMTEFGEDHEMRIKDLEDSQNFLSLEDTPGAYGAAGLSVVINGAGDGLEFASIGAAAPVTFPSLTDTPASYEAATPGGMLILNNTADGIEFGPAPSAPPDQFTDLIDTPSTLVANQYLKVRSDGTKLEFVPQPVTAPTTFVSLTDTPSDFSGRKGQFVQVNQAESELIFAHGTGGGSTTFVGLTDTPADYDHGTYLRVHPTQNRIEAVDLDIPTSLLHLGDTPTAWGSVGQILSVASGGDELEWVSQSAAAVSFLDLTDTPASFAGVNNYILTVDGSEIVFSPPSAGGVTDFTDLDDTPANYTGASVGDLVTVGSGNTLEFTAAPAVIANLDDIPDVPAYASQGLKHLRVNAAETAVEWVTPATGGGVASAPIIVAVDSETSVVTAGSSKVVFRAPQAMTLATIGCKLSLTDPSTDGYVEVDIRVEGTSIFSTKPRIDEGHTTSLDSGTTVALSTTSINDDDEIRIDVSLDGTGAIGLKVALIPE